MQVAFFSRILEDRKLKRISLVEKCISYMLKDGLKSISADVLLLTLLLHTLTKFNMFH